jgi:hypothetical protein
MKARIVVLPDGSIRLFVDEGDFSQASAKLRALAQALGGQLAEIGEVEQHRHADGAVVHTHVHAEA